MENHPFLWRRIRRVRRIQVCMARKGLKRQFNCVFSFHWAALCTEYHQGYCIPSIEQRCALSNTKVIAFQKKVSIFTFAFHCPLEQLPFGFCQRQTGGSVSDKTESRNVRKWKKMIIKVITKCCFLTVFHRSPLLLHCTLVERRPYLSASNRSRVGVHGSCRNADVLQHGRQSSQR